MRILAGAHDRMERLAGWTEFHSRIRLRRLTIDQRPSAFNAVRMAAETQFVLAGHGLDVCAGGADARDPRDGTGRIRRGGALAGGRMRIVAVGTSNMAR